MKAPDINFEYELILVIANEGHTDAVMDAARAAGAGGGTVIHAKGTGGMGTEKFFNVSIASEKKSLSSLRKGKESGHYALHRNDGGRGHRCRRDSFLSSRFRRRRVQTGRR